MRVAFRAVTVCLVLVLALTGPLAPFASAQQPTAPPPAQPPQMFQEDVKPLPPREGTDIYDVGAVIGREVDTFVHDAMVRVGVGAHPERAGEQLRLGRADGGRRRAS